MSETRRPVPVVKVPMPAPRARTAPPVAAADTLQQFARGTDQSLPISKEHAIAQGTPAQGTVVDPAAITEKLDPAQHAAAAHAAELRELEDKLSRCLASITMHFQPIVHAHDRSRFGYEALLRSTDKALPHPGAILDAAERLERVQPLGRAIRAQVAKVVTAAPAERGMVFLNLHLLDLLDKQLTSAFAPLSKVASRVILEITERTSIEGHDIRYRVAELRELGFKIAIDDLGGGHARMGTFTPLDTDFIKLDMSLVRDIDKQPMKQRLVRSLTEICRDHGTKVIGEGVETEAEASMLVSLGCDLLQGYLIAKPALPFCDPL